MSLRRRRYFSFSGGGGPHRDPVLQVQSDLSHGKVIGMTASLSKDRPKTLVEYY